MITANERNDSKLVCFKASLAEQETIARYLRGKSWQIVLHAQSGHLGGTSSSVELLTALYFGGYLNLDLNDNTCPNHDKVMIRGHLGPLRYSIFHLLGWVDDNELDKYRKFGSRLQGHEKMGAISGIDITPSGALGLILSYGVGSAINAKIENLGYNSFVFLGDGEEQEGNISEAARHAASMKLNNLICIIDKNGKQLSRPTKDVDSSDLKSIWRGYGWEVFEIRDGHDLEEINAVYEKVLSSSGNEPRVIIANTVKGNGLPGAIDSANGFHTVHAFGVEALDDFLRKMDMPETEEIREIIFRAKKVNLASEICATPEFNKNDFFMEMHTGESIEGELALFFERSARLMDKNLPLYVMTADLIMTSETIKYGLRGKSKYIDVGIREQHLFALAHGLSVSNPDARVVLKSHDAFLYRAADQVQAINLGGSRVVVFGDYGGLSGGFNGETHESVGQLGTVLMMSNAIVFEPSDAIDFWKIVNYALTENPGLVYIRLYSRASKILPRIDGQDWFYRTHEPRQKPKLVLVSSGLTANDTMEAGRQLENDGLPARVVNVVGLTAIQTLNFVELFEPDVPVLTVYNGNPLILQSLIATALTSFSRAGMSRVIGHGFTDGESGTIDDLKELYGLNPNGIVRKAKSLL